ncbi:MAG: hypothetical protein MUC43_10635, partial [Pirellula sp.]|nr:hypothetical protein [Pirellula sp.]
FFRAQDKGVLASSLYVAMTRARSILTLFAHRNSHVHARKIFKAVEDCLDCLQDRPEIDVSISQQDDVEDVLQWVGEEHRRWLQRTWSEKKISQEPIFSQSGELIAEPLFWYREQGVIHACFGKEVLSQRAIQKLDDFGVKIVRVGRV